MTIRPGGRVTSLVCYRRPARLPVAPTIRHCRGVRVAGFMAELRMREDVPARALEFTILTAARTGEVVGARWSEIDLETNAWIIPAARMKSRREHRVPLSARSN